MSTTDSLLRTWKFLSCLFLSKIIWSPILPSSSITSFDFSPTLPIHPHTEIITFWKSFVGFPRPPSASLHPWCSRASGRAHMTQGSTILGSLLAPILGNPCVTAPALLHLFLLGSSNIHAPASTGAFYTAKMRICSSRASLLEVNSTFLCPYLLLVYCYRVLGFCLRTQISAQWELRKCLRRSCWIEVQRCWTFSSMNRGGT